MGVVSDGQWISVTSVKVENVIEGESMNEIHYKLYAFIEQR